MQKIANKLRNDESVARKQTEPDKQEMNEVSMQQERNPTTVSQFLTEIQDLQNKVNSLSDAREF